MTCITYITDHTLDEHTQHINVSHICAYINMLMCVAVSWCRVCDTSTRTSMWCGVCGVCFMCVVPGARELRAIYLYIPRYHATAALKFKVRATESDILQKH